MPKAITTKFHGWTASRPSRVSASDGDTRVYVTAQDPNTSDNAFGGAHDRAALALCAKRGWTGTLIRGGMGDDGGYAYVFADSDRLVIPGTARWVSVKGGDEIDRNITNVALFLADAEAVWNVIVSEHPELSIDDIHARLERLCNKTVAE